MITPKEAYTIVKNQIKSFVGRIVVDYGEFYVIDNCKPGDCNLESYKIDKTTGAITDFHSWII